MPPLPPLKKNPVMYVHIYTCCMAWPIELQYFFLSINNLLLCFFVTVSIFCAYRCLVKVVKGTYALSHMLCCTCVLKIRY